MFEEMFRSQTTALGNSSEGRRFESRVEPTPTIPVALIEMEGKIFDSVTLFDFPASRSLAVISKGGTAE